MSLNTSTSENNKRIAKNTLYLYLRTFFVMAVSIFTSRIVLDVLGINDFGIYNVVGAFVAMFSLLSGTLTAATQRFITYELGKEHPESNKIFSVSLGIHLILAIVIFLLLESVGLWFLNYKMNISPDRLLAANWVFQCSVLTFCINLISIPYNASIIAHERMNVFAVISIFEVLAKLAVAYILMVFNGDKLIVYAVLLLIVAVLLRIIYGIYCKRNFSECYFHIVKDKAVYIQMLSFSGWNFIGSTAGILNTQGINVLINLFFGVTFNAARGVAEQINTAINSFVMNFMTAINPQITKSFASGNYEYLNTLIVKGTKYSFFLYWFICLPLMLESEYVLNLWLVEVPSYAPILLRYAMIYTACQLLSQTLYTSMLATGNIKKYQIVVGSLSILAFPIAYVFFKCGLPVEYGYIATIIMSLVCLGARLIMLRDMIPQFSISAYNKDGLLRILMVVCISYGILLIGTKYIEMFSTGLVGFVITCIVSFLITICCIFILGITKQERTKIQNYVIKKIR